MEVFCKRKSDTTSLESTKSAWMDKLFTKSALIRLVIRVIRKMNVKLTLNRYILLRLA